MSNTKPCPYCAEFIQKEAIFCKHCKKDLSTNKNKKENSESGTLVEVFKKNKTWAIVGIVAVLIFVFYLGSQSSKSDQDIEVLDQNDEVAQVVDNDKSEEIIELEPLENEVQTEEVKTLGISYDQMMANLTDTFPMEYMPLDDGGERYFGQGEHASLEIIGDKSDISQTTLILLVGDNDNNEELTTISKQFLRNALPNWLDGEEWLSEALAYLAGEVLGEAQTTYQGKLIKVVFSAELEMLFISVAPEEAEEQVEIPEDEPVTVASETVSQKNAVSSAQDYLNFTAFSYDGLVKQLEFEGFSHADAVYGVDNSNADWNEQAAKAAQNYLDFTAFSRSGLIEQLVFEGFTQAQAEYGVNAVGL